MAFDRSVVLIALLATVSLGAQAGVDDELLTAAKGGDSDSVKLLLDNGAPIEARDALGNTALMWAAAMGHTETAKLLLDRRANIDAQSKTGLTALIGSASRGQADCVKLLLERGANIESRDGLSGRTALIDASAQGKVDIVKLLLNKGANVNTKDNQGAAALTVAAGSPSIVKLLLDGGADIKSRNKDGFTALMEAAAQGEADTVKLLLERGASVWDKTNHGQTVLMLGEISGDSNVIELIENALAARDSSASASTAVQPSGAVTFASRDHKAGQAQINSRDGLTYVWIPPGKFQMGCSSGDLKCYENEKPSHEVELTKGFWIGQVPVPQEAYEKVTGSNPSYFRGEQLPVERVSWDDAVGYCEAIGMRLPTEAEWEYAARGGTVSAQYGKLDSIAWYENNSQGHTHVVGQKLPNFWNLYDMLGNVWEWTADRYDEKNYRSSGVRDPKGADTGVARTIRGGAIDSSMDTVRVSYRIGHIPRVRNVSSVGFRCVGE